MPALKRIPKGTTFNDWMTLGETITVKGIRKEKCQCLRCLGEHFVSVVHLKSGASKRCRSCSYAIRDQERLNQRNRKHGMSNSNQYLRWNAMRSRCNNPNNLSYEHYGARGISVCKEWNEDFSAFWADMGSTYFDGAQIDRIDNDKGYSKENCRWTTPKVNSRNRRNNRFISIAENRKTLAEWKEILSKLSFEEGLKALGISLERAIEILT